MFLPSGGVICYSDVTYLPVDPDASPSQPDTAAWSTTDEKEDNKCVIDDEGDTYSTYEELAQRYQGYFFTMLMTESMIDFTCNSFVHFYVFLINKIATGLDPVGYLAKNKKH